MRINLPLNILRFKGELSNTTVLYDGKSSSSIDFWLAVQQVSEYASSEWFRSSRIFSTSRDSSVSSVEIYNHIKQFHEIFHSHKKSFILLRIDLISSIVIFLTLFITFCNALDTPDFPLRKLKFILLPEFFIPFYSFWRMGIMAHLCIVT